MTIAAGTTTNGYVTVRKTASGDIVIPYSIYQNGEIIFQTAITGTFDVIYNAKTFTDITGHWALGNVDFLAGHTEW